LSNLVALFINNLFPILLIAGIGYLLGKTIHIDPRSISRVVFYVFSPCLVFTALTSSQLTNGDLLKMAGFTISIVVSMAVITFLIGKLMKLNRSMLAAVILTTMTINAGNYGLSLNSFAFGDEGLAHASIFYATTALCTYTLGVAVASMGTVNLKESLLRLLKVPAIYAVVLALVFISQGWELPLPLERTTTSLGNAAIPAMLILLGLQLQNNHRSKAISALTLGTGMRMIGGVALGFGFAALFGLHGAAYQAGVVEAAMPSAVLSTVLATEFEVEPAFVTSTVFITTLLSPITLTPLIAYLGA
jgi:predicted permease